MKTELIDIKTPDGLCDTFIARPDHLACPAVLLFMDAYGPRKCLYEMAQKLAEHGYCVVVPNMFYRVKKAPVVDLSFPLKKQDMPGAVELIMALLKVFQPGPAMQDVDVFLDFLAAQQYVRQGKIGTVGYCMGGALALRTAARHPDRVAAAASFHGGNLAVDNAHSPHLLLNRIKAELYIAHADHDKSMPAEQIERLNSALSTMDVAHRAEVYTDALHGFTMADLPVYDQTACERHWHTLLDLLARNL